MIENLLLTNSTTGQEIGISMDSTSYVLEWADFGTIIGTHQTYHYPTQIGSTKYSSTMDTREVKIIGWVIGESKEEISSRKDKLNKLINPLEDIVIQVEEKYFITLSPSNTISYGKNYDENNDVMCKFEITGICYDPVFTSGINKVTASGIEGCFMFPLIIPEEGYVFSKRISSLICTVENDGIIDSGIEIIFKATGTVKNPSIINVTTQESFKLIKTLVANEEVVINTVIGSRSITGFLEGEEYNYFKYRDFENGDWVSFKKGINLYRHDAEEGLDNLDVILRYKRSWLEVDA